MWLGKKQPPSERPPERAERRTPVHRCANCRRVANRFAYLENRKHYCVNCAYQVRRLMGLQSIGRRANDIKIA
jgi:hypothetical protein